MTDRKVPSLISDANISRGIEMWDAIINDPDSTPQEIEGAKKMRESLLDSAIDYKMGLNPDQKRQ